MLLLCSRYRVLIACALLAYGAAAARTSYAQQRWPDHAVDRPRVLGSVDVDPAAEYGSPGEDAPPEATGSWLPHWTLPHPDLAEQLWRPGDLVEDTYFLRRPWHAGFLVGTMNGDNLTGEVDQATDWFDGLRIGNDFSPHWGWEVRTAFFSPDLTYADGLQQGMAKDWFVDLNVLNYPWGDTRLRPFWSIGLGGALVKFTNEDSLEIRDWLVDLPLSIGCKYHWKPWLVVRGELTDTILFGNENIDTQNNLSLSVGAEIHWHSFKTRPIKYGY